ncbi:MAG: helix-turn-helix transcriptional regulator [Emcibacter sp.]|nr:helix-turn-helix transcriptional regulator [Emcibacter sp.]
MESKNRSHCPVTYALDLIGDKWSLLMLRDIILFDKKYYHEFTQSLEGISTNILANRLAMLEGNGILLKVRDEQDKKRFIYSPTEKGLDLLPVIISMVLWSAKYDADTVAPLDEIKKIEQDPAAFMNKVRSKFSGEKMPDPVAL